MKDLRFIFSEPQKEIKVDYKKITNKELAIWLIFLVVITGTNLVMAFLIYLKQSSNDSLTHHTFLWLLCSMVIISYLLIIWQIELRKVFNHILQNQVFEDKKIREEYLNKAYLKIHGQYTKSYAAILGYFIPLTIVQIVVYEASNYFNYSIYIPLLIFTFLSIGFIPDPILEEYISKNKLVYKFTFSDRTCGIKPILSYLNVCLFFQFTIITFCIISLYSIFFETDFIHNIKCIYYMLFGDKEVDKEIIASTIVYYFAFSFSLALLFEIGIYAIKAYYSIINDLTSLKKKLLSQYEKKDDLKSIILYDKVKEKAIISPIDKIILPVKLLLSPTLMTYLRNKIMTANDIDILLKNFFS